MMIQERKKNERHERILSSLDSLTYATRRQLQIVNNLGGDRNAHRILFEMEKDKVISSIRTEQKIYYLSNTGKQRIGSGQGELKRSWVTHSLMRNDLYIELGMPSGWKKEQPVTWNDNQLIPDATFKVNDEYRFVEIDNKQKMQTNNDKIKKYTNLAKAIYRRYGHHPLLIWYSLSNIRKQKLSKACIQSGIKFKIY